MVGMSNTQNLEIYIGTKTKVGTLILHSGTARKLELIYAPEWVENGFPISPHLPLKGDIDSLSIENYLRNLLPEGAAFDQMLKETGIRGTNTFGLIKMLGNETSGALSFRTADSNPPETSFRQVEESELAERLQYGEALACWDGKVRLSVAGVQDKLNMLIRDGVMGFGDGTLSSNYILKFESGKAPCIAVNEYFCMTLAKLIGMDVANVSLDIIGKTRTLMIERFDRSYIQSRETVARKHLIDGCQATDLPPDYKYERQNGDDGDGIYIRDGVSFPKLFGIQTTDNIKTRLQITQWMVFNLATLNYDAHGKNISFFVDKNGLSLAPFYDLVNIQAIANEGAKRNAMSGKLNAQTGRMASIPQFLAMSIGDWDRVDFQLPPIGNFQRPITAFNFADFGDECGYTPVKMTQIVSETANAILNNLDKAVEAVEKQGVTDDERAHITMCVELITEECQHLLNESEMIEEMSDLL